MLIRKAIAADIPRVVELWRGMWRMHEESDARFASTPYAAEFMDRWYQDSLEAERAIFLVAEEGGRVEGYALGFIVENPPVVPHRIYGHISEVAVAPERRRGGIGGDLTREMHERFRARGCGYVEAFVAVCNPVSQGFWRKSGYRPFIERMRFELGP